jgi:hypothetical protein
MHWPGRPTRTSPWTPRPGNRHLTISRSFQIRDIALKGAALLLSSTYDIKDVKVTEAENSISVRTTPAIADACAALLRELGFLAE